MPKKFITFEGGEGTGKSTQAALLAEKLRSLSSDIDVVITREPGGSERAEKIRTVLLDNALPAPTQLTETLMFYAARSDHIHHVIQPALDAGKWVVCDRFSDSTRAYQGVAGGLDGQIIDRLEEWVISNGKPGLTVILDLQASVGLARAANRRKGGANSTLDRFESMNLEFHEKLRQAFLQIAKDDSDRCFVVDAEGDQSAIAVQIWDLVRQRWSLAS